MGNKAGIGSHTKPNDGITNVWLTPQHIVGALGEFDLDPCAAPSPRPWPTALHHIELPEDGLTTFWNQPEYRQGTAFARVWLNPPSGRETDLWLAKMSRHIGAGIALIFARTETESWQKWVWPFAHSVFFFDGRLYLRRADGTKAKGNAGGPSALVSYSPADTASIRYSGLPGYLVLSPERLPHGS